MLLFDFVQGKFMAEILWNGLGNIREFSIKMKFYRIVIQLFALKVLGKNSFLLGNAAV